MTIEFDDFLKVDIRVGTVVNAEPYPEARKLVITLLSYFLFTRQPCVNSLPFSCFLTFF